MGIVCLAHDPVMGRDLAIKTILLPHGLPEEQKYEFRRRFRREAQAAGRLSHPGIVTVYDYSESEDDLPFIAMEYVKGFTLHELIDKDGALSSDWALDMAEMLADALDAAHAAGVVHRDLKPANILIREADGAAKITDFGIARINSNDMTQAGTTYGSPAYMAPERILGKPADSRSDLFSLAVILYEALSGKRPFNGEDFNSICYAIVNAPPIPIRTHQPELSLAFDAFFRRALAKNPAERFQNGVDFRQGLESVRHQQRIFEAGSETLKLTIPTSQAAITELFQVIATPVPASRSVVPWRWIAIGAVALLLVLGSFIAGWILSGGERDGQVGVPLDVNTHPAAVKLVEAVEGVERSVPVEEPASIEVVAPAEPTTVVPQPAVLVAPKPPPAEARPPANPEPETPVESAGAEPPPDDPAMQIAVEATEEVEPAPVAVVPAGVPVNVRIKNSFKDGKLTILVDDEEIRSIPLEISPEKNSGSITIEIPPGHHSIRAVVSSTAKDREYEAAVELDLEPGDMRTIQIVAGKTLGKRLTMKLD